jgi:hypothetical protein
MKKKNAVDTRFSIRNPRGYHAGRAAMTRRFLTLFFILLAFPALACAEARVEVIESDPASPVTLAHWEQYFVRIAYETDQPIRVRGDAYAGGKRVTAMTSGSPRYEPGTGEALFWFSYTTPARVDRVVVWAEDEKTRQPVAKTEIGVDLEWTGQKSATRRRQADWVTHMLAEQNRRSREEIREHMDRPTPWWETMLFFAAIWSIPIYFIMQVVLLRRWRGGWRVAAAIPAVPMLFILGHAIFAFVAGSNIFPLGLIFTAAPALMCLLVLMAVRWLKLKAAG